MSSFIYIRSKRNKVSENPVKRPDEQYNEV